MNDPRASGQPRFPSAGLCADCAHARIVVSDRGSRFLRCGRSATDARYPRYPVLPVWQCPGYETGAGSAGER